MNLIISQIKKIVIPRVLKQNGFNPNTVLPRDLPPELRIELGFRVTQLSFLL